MIPFEVRMQEFGHGRRALNHCFWQPAADEHVITTKHSVLSLSLSILINAFDILKQLLCQLTQQIIDNHLFIFFNYDFCRIITENCRYYDILVPQL
jgi:hypothetical protein